MPLLELLPQARQTAPDLVDVILEKDQVENGFQPSPLAQLPEPLTNQELRVLALIVAGKSNQQIADELVITLGTASGMCTTSCKNWTAKIVHKLLFALRNWVSSLSSST